MPENIFPGVSLSILRQATTIERGRPLLMSGRFTALGFGLPAFIRVYMEGPSYDPQVRGFDTFSAPFSGDYTVNVLAEKDGQYEVYAQAFPPPPFPVGPPFPEAILLGPPLAESPRPPVAVGRPIAEGVEALLPTGERRRYTSPPMTPAEIFVTVAPTVAVTVPGVPAPAPAYPPPAPFLPPLPFAPPAVPPPEVPVPDFPTPEMVGTPTVDIPRELVVGQTLTGRVLVPTTAPATYLFSIALEMNGTPVATDVMSVYPGQTVTLPVMFDTTGFEPGDYNLLVRVSDQLGRTLLSMPVGVFSLLPIPEVPLAPPTVSGLGATFTPSEVSIGERATGTLYWFPSDTVPFAFGIRADLTDWEGRVVKTVLRANPTVTMGAPQATPLSFNTSELREGAYGLLVTFTDLATGVELFRGHIPNILRLIPVEVPPPEFPEFPTPDMVGSPTLEFPTEATVGDVLSGSLVVPTSAPIAYPFNVSLNINGVTVASDMMNVQPGGEAVLPLQLDTSEFSEGSYNLIARVTDQMDNRLLQQFMASLTLFAIPVPPPPEFPEFPTPDMLRQPIIEGLPRELTVGDIWTGSIEVPTMGQAPYRFQIVLELDAFIASYDWITVEAGKPLVLPVNFDTGFLDPGDYDILLIVSDELGNMLLEGKIGKLALLPLPEVPPPPVPRPPEVPPRFPWEVFWPTIDVTLDVPRREVKAGEDIQIGVTVLELDYPAGDIALMATLLNPTGVEVGRAGPLELGEGRSVNITLVTEPTWSQGGYHLRIQVWPSAVPLPDVERFFFDQVFSNVFFLLVPAVAGAITNVFAPGRIAAGETLRVSVAWNSTVPAYVTAALFEPPNYTSYRSSNSGPVREVGSYTEDIDIRVLYDNAQGNNTLAVQLVSEAGEVLDARRTSVMVEVGVVPF